MQEKLNAGDTFPAMTLTVLGGDTLSLPGAAGLVNKDGYRVILFYRGHW